MGNTLPPSGGTPVPGISCGPFGGPCCYTITGEDFNDDPQGLWDFCSNYNCCKTSVGTPENSYTCDTWSESPDAYYTICEDSCLGDESCARIGQNFDDGKDSFHFIANQDSCLEDAACYELCQSTTGDCIVGTGSCQGQDACSRVTNNNKNKEVTIGNDSCVGEYACNRIANGDDAKIDTLTIGNDSCLRNFACQNMGFNAKKTITVANQACDGGDTISSAYACYFTGYSAGDGLTIGRNSCFGPAACSFAGFDTDKGQVSIGRNSCVADFDGSLVGYSCDNVGKESQKDVTIENFACRGDSACRYTGIYQEEVTISSFTCLNGIDSECYKCSDIEAPEDNLQIDLFGSCPYDSFTERDD